MPGAKRITKTVSYAEHDDDDDFVSKADTKKSRNTKTNERSVEPKPTATRQPPRKRNEKLTKDEQAEIELAIKLSNEQSVQLNEISIELPNLSNYKQEKNVSSNESKTNDEEILLPKSKRMKREEEQEEEVVIEEVKKNDESSSEEEIDEDEEIDEEEEEEAGKNDDDDQEEQSPPRKKTTRKSDESQKPIENTNRLVTRNQQKSSSISTSEQVKKKPNAPVGFPTGKINIPASQPSRVGLSRRSGAIKPLHPNLNQRVLHE